MNDQKQAASEDKVRYVEELASAEAYPEGDYWLTLTDAARVTKRQDKTIRDWVQQGKLPVRPVHLGINKRTRQVRASDLAQLTPILDQTAAITTEAGQIYLTSIPGEMQQIRTMHEVLLAEAARLQQEVEGARQNFAWKRQKEEGCGQIFVHLDEEAYQ
ncbi:helix-turn-helix domain-containing protein [Ktedonobacteria bacterium brp13]|nr:helix-turn-helix domain-containing protein [Ktedonobacteria bacterium brp13]